MPFPDSPAKGWPYRFRSRGTIGSSILDDDSSHSCRGKRIHTSGHCDLGFFNNFEASSIFLGISRYCVRCLSCASWQSGDDIHDFCCCHLRCWWSFVQWILQKIQNHLSRCRLGVQFDLYIFGALPPIRHFSNDICPSVRQNELLRPSSLLHRTPLSCFWLSSGSTPKFCPISSNSLSTAAFAAGFFEAWGIGINLWTKLWCCSELSPFPATWSSQSCRLPSFQNTRKSCFNFVGCTNSSSNFYMA